MYAIRAGQIKAARALLGWSQGDLAAATGLSVTTIRNLESGEMSPRSATAHIIYRVFEDNCMEFIEPEGVRRRMDEVRIYQGPDSCILFFSDVLDTVKEKGGNVISVFKSLEAMTQSCSVTQSNLERLERIAEIAAVKCLLPEVSAAPAIIEGCQFRTITQKSIGPTSFVVYGNKHAIVLMEGQAFRFIVIKSSSMAKSFTDYFFSLWDNSHPFLTTVSANQPRIRT